MNAYDIRDQPSLKHDDILGLNFIRAPGRYFFKRHYRAGLRSHIMEVLKKEDVEKEKRGVIIDGLRWYPKARPSRMLRIFRTRFNTLREAEEELKRVKIIESYLAPDHLARSNEFLVDYCMKEHREFILCGLQEYVEGEILDPWSSLDRDHFASLFSRMCSVNQSDTDITIDQWMAGLREKGEHFVIQLKKMILEINHVPDLAGIGNLLLTKSGDIRLVDINNISTVSLGPDIYLDDRGYPVCDKSIEALFHFERGLLDPPSLEKDEIYRVFLDPERVKAVNSLVDEFTLSMKSRSSPASYPTSP